MAAGDAGGKRFPFSPGQANSVFAPSPAGHYFLRKPPNGTAGRIFMAARKNEKLKIQDTTLRHLWLAGLGVAESARRESIKAANDAAERFDVLKKRAGTLADETQVNVREGIASVREQGGTRASQFSAEVEARLAPVLVKLGLKPAAAKRPRKTTRKTAAKRTTAASKRPAAKRKAS